MSCVRFSVAKHRKTAIGKQDTKPCRSRFHGVDQAMLETTLDRVVEMVPDLVDKVEKYFDRKEEKEPQ